MRVIIDTEKEQIIVPDTFYKTIDKKNEVLAKAGAEIKIEYEKYVKDAFEKAMNGIIESNLKNWSLRMFSADNDGVVCENL